MNIRNLTKLTFMASLLCTPNLWAAKLAIVIDDLGYRKNDLKIFNMDTNINVAIIPSSPHALDRDRRAFEQNRDILIHMPMDSGKKPIEPEVIKIGMDQQKIRHLIDYAKKRVPHAVGLNNHMGAQGTSNAKLMEDFASVFKYENKFVLDSVTTGRSYLAKKTKAAGIKTLRRNIFLDHVNDEASINAAFDLAIRMARKKGAAIAIGHPRIHTIRVLQQRLANLPDDIELVKLSSLIPKPQRLDDISSNTPNQEHKIIEETQVKPEVLPTDKKDIVEKVEKIEKLEKANNTIEPSLQNDSLNSDGVKQWLLRQNK